MTPESQSIVPPATIAPVVTQERTASIEVLRGFAVLGILLMSIISFGLAFAYIDPTRQGGSTGANLVYWYANQIFFEGKMRALFSLLFGTGAVLLILRAEARDSSVRVADIFASGRWNGCGVR